MLESLGVDIHRDLAVCMAQQLLHDFDIFPISRSTVEYVWRNVCLPACFVMPTRFTAG